MPNNASAFILEKIRHLFQKHIWSDADKKEVIANFERLTEHWQKPLRWDRRKQPEK